jgi:DNA polymerase III delta subunit
MVKKESSVYLFIGQDSLSKDIKLKGLRQEFFAKEIEQFNLDILYAEELTLKELQERLLSLPFKAKKRIVVIKDVQHLREDIKEFILKYVKNPSPQILLVLDINRQAPQDEFIKHILRYVQVYRFRETVPLNTFTLSRQVNLRKPDYALRVLNQLLKNGERPERILGGLRYTWEQDMLNPLERRKRLKLLLNCDIDIKTGRLKPDFALERLIVKLCLS